MTDISTLLKLEYNTLEQFVQDVNRNFAVLENSPLYKGVPGNPGNPGNPGSLGIRGSVFLFVDYDKFIKEYPNELTIGSDINISYINSKLTNQAEREKLFKLFGVTTFVDKDIVVLTDSSMISYNEVSDMFINTGLAFNADTNLEANINSVIESYVKSYIEQNEIINSLANIFSAYTTYGKNYSDKNSSYLTNQILNTTVFSPFITGFNNQNGILIDNHKYFGYSDQYFPLSNDGSFIFGSTKRYYQLLMETISNDTNQSLSSDYAPGVGNIPSLIVLQDTTNNGILIGYKGKNNLKRFGSIYKNSSDDLVIKSDSGKLVSEFSELRINRQYLKFDKLVQFGDTLEVSRNLSVFGEINQKHLRSGLYTVSKSANLLEIGIKSNNSEVSVVSNDLSFTSFVDTVLVTGQGGKVSKLYKIEKAVLNTNDVLGFAQITNIPNSPNNILTSNYYYQLATKINNVTTYINTNYWTKKNFTDNVIPTLNLTDTLKVDKKLIVGGNDINVTTGVTNFVGNNFNVSNTNIKFSNYKSKVLVTDNNGLIENSYVLSKNNPFIFDSKTGIFTINLNTIKYNEIVTNENLFKLGNTFVDFSDWIKNNYWNKTQWTTGVIANLTLSNLLKSKNIEVTNHLLTTNQTLRIGYGANYDIALESSLIRFNKFTNKVLVTNSNGSLVQTHEILKTDYTSTYNPNANSLTNKPIFSNFSSSSDNNNNNIVLGKHSEVLIKFGRDIITFVDDVFWRKGHWTTNSIPTLKLNTLLTVSGNAVLGGNSVTDNANIIANGDTTIIGKVSTGNVRRSLTIINGDAVRLPRLIEKVLVTTSSGNISNSYNLAKVTPTSSDSSGVTDWFNHNTIKLKFWTKGVIQNFLNYPTALTDIVTGKYIDWIVGNFKAIRDLLYDRPTYAEINNMTPIGMIVMWDASLINTIPTNYVICDGRIIPGTNKYTKNLVDKHVKFVNSNPGNVTGNNNNRIKITIDQLPKHRFSGYTQSGGAHSHLMFSSRGGTGGPELSSTTDVVRRGGNKDRRYYALTKDDAAYATQTVGATNNTGSHSHYFESNEIGQGLDVNIEPTSVGVIPVMRYK